MVMSQKIETKYYKVANQWIIITLPLKKTFICQNSFFMLHPHEINAAIKLIKFVNVF